MSSTSTAVSCRLDESWPCHSEKNIVNLIKMFSSHGLSRRRAGNSDRWSSRRRGLTTTAHKQPSAIDRGKDYPPSFLSIRFISSQEYAHKKVARNAYAQIGHARSGEKKKLSLYNYIYAIVFLLYHVSLFQSSPCSFSLLP